MRYFESLDAFYNKCFEYDSIKEFSENIPLSRGTINSYLVLLRENEPEKYQLIKNFWNEEYRKKVKSQVPKRTIHKLNDFAFDVLTEESAYWLGFLASDGYVNKNGNCVSIMLKGSDKEHLDKFIKFLDYSGSVHNSVSKTRNKSYPSCYVSFHSKHIKEKLGEYGIVPAKSNLDIDYLSYIPDNFKMFFLFGYLDGDGFITKPPEMSISRTIEIGWLGNYSLIESIKQYMSSFLNKKLTISEDNKYSYTKYVCQVSGMEACLKFLKKYVKYPFILERKRKRAEEWIKYIEPRLEEKRIRKSLPKHVPKYHRHTREDKYCPICGKQIQYDSTYCESCYHIQSRKVERPTKEELINLILQYPITKIGEIHGVSDNAVRKWLKSYDLPVKSADIKAFRELHKQSQEESSV